MYTSRGQTLLNYVDNAIRAKRNHSTSSWISWALTNMTNDIPEDWCKITTNQVKIKTGLFPKKGGGGRLTSKIPQIWISKTKVAFVIISWKFSTKGKIGKFWSNHTFDNYFYLSLIILHHSRLDIGILNDINEERRRKSREILATSIILEHHFWIEDCSFGRKSTKLKMFWSTYWDGRWTSLSTQ